MWILLGLQFSFGLKRASILIYHSFMAVMFSLCWRK